MKLGLLTAPFEDSDLLDVAKWASTNRFSALEVACWPCSGGEKRRYAGTSHINVDGLSFDQGQQIVGELEAWVSRFRVWATIQIRCTQILIIEMK